MISLRIVGNEVSALGTAALAMPLRFLLRGQPFDPHAPNPTPVVLVHGFLGDPTNFLALRSHLAARGIRNFVNFSYPPRLDYQRLACRPRQTAEAACLHTFASPGDLAGRKPGGRLPPSPHAAVAPPPRRATALVCPYLPCAVPPPCPA